MITYSAVIISWKREAGVDPHIAAVYPFATCPSNELQEELLRSEADFRCSKANNETLTLEIKVNRTGVFPTFKYENVPSHLHIAIGEVV